MVTPGDIPEFQSSGNGISSHIPPTPRDTQPLAELKKAALMEALHPLTPAQEVSVGTTMHFEWQLHVITW
jgi:hypothetical protein